MIVVDLGSCDNHYVFNQKDFDRFVEIINEQSELNEKLNVFFRNLKDKPLD